MSSVDRREIEARFDDLRDFIKTGFNTLNKRIDEVGHRVDQVGARVDTMDARINGRIRTIETESVPEVETRVAVVETQVADIRSERWLAAKQGLKCGGIATAVLAAASWLLEHWPW